MNSQEKKIVVGGVVIAALSSAGFSMAQGDFNHIDDDYKSPTIISEKTLASNEITSINTLKTDVAIVDENNEEEENEIKDESNEKVKSKVTVDVKGAVVNPGVYTLKAGARVTDVIQEAGGMTEDADAKSVNLAASLSDEEVIYVANKDENVSVLDQTSTGQVSDKGGQDVSKDGKINLNTETSEQLQTISGIGAKRTEDIIAYRESHGGFQSVDDLKNVSGIGDKTLDKIRESLYVA